MKVKTDQKGYILLLVPIVLVGLSALAFKAINHSNTSMRIAGAQLGYLQTRMCAQQCAAVAVNSTNQTLESNGKVTQHSEACSCADGNPGKTMNCATAYDAPEEKPQYNCYGLEVAKTDMDINIACHEDQNQAVSLSENVSFQEVPIFQFAVFFEQVLELYPGQDMDITGKIHSNDTVRVFPSQNNMRMYDWVTSAKVIVGKNSKDGNPAWTGFPLMDGSGPDALMSFSNSSFQPLDQLISGFDAWQKNHRVAYADRSGACGRVERLSLPVKNMDDPHALIDWRDPLKDDISLQREKFAWRADLIYKGGWKENNLTSASLSSNPLGIISPWKTSTVLDGAGPRVKFWDGRDTVYVKVLPINVARLQNRATDSLIYLYDQNIDATQGNKDVGGFLLYNGAKLKRPLTVVSNSRIYTWGNFNVDSSYVLPDGTKKPFPAALIADVYTQLSNEWDGTVLVPGVKSGGAPITDKNAKAATTLNSCVMTGMAERNGSWTNQGGYQNIIHFMENWKAVPFAYSGSTACLWTAKVSTGFTTTEFYFPPIRNWSFDSMYKDMANMPPATPRLVYPKLNTWELSRN